MPTKLFQFSTRDSGRSCLREVLCKLALLLVLCTSPALGLAKEPRVIVNESLASSELSLKSLRSIFTMKQRFWQDGQRIKVFVLPNDHDSHKAFCRKILNVFPRQLESVWYRLVYSGTGDRPIELGSEEEMFQRIADTPGAIGYVLTESSNEDIRVINIH